MEEFAKTSEQMAIEGYRHLLKETETFINRNSLESFGAGLSGIGLPDYELARRVLAFIYEQNCKEDLRIMEEKVNENQERF